MFVKIQNDCSPLVAFLHENNIFFLRFCSILQIVEVEMPFDKQKNQRKAFCFITFDSEQVVNELLKTPKQTISGKEVDVKKATPKPDNVPGMIQLCQCRFVCF